MTRRGRSLPMAGVDHAAHDIKRLDLFLTEACNLGCDYCFAATNPRKNPTDADLRRGVDWLMKSASSKVHITLWGGEPLLRADLLRRTVEYARSEAAAHQKTITFAMPTNASFLDDETLAWLREHRVQMFLSIDGDERVQGDSRPLKSGGSSHDIVSAGMENALAGDRPPPIRMTVTPGNAAQQATGARYFLSRGARELLIYAANDQHWEPDELAAYEAAQMELAELFCDLVRTAESPEDIPRFKAWLPVLSRLYDGVPARSRTGRVAHCGIGRELVGLTVTGEFTPCHRYVFYARNREERTGLGDIRTGFDPEGLRELAELQVDRLEGKSPCTECDIFDLCTFGCPAVAYTTTGRVDRVPPQVCALQEAQVRVCTFIHDQLAGDPFYAAYLGKSVARAVDATARSLAARALANYQAMTEETDHAEA